MGRVREKKHTSANGCCKICGRHRLSVSGHGIRRKPRGPIPKFVLYRGTGLGHALAQGDALLGGNAEQVCRAPDDVFLEFADVVVGVDQLPHHLDDTGSCRIIHRAVDQTGEMIQSTASPSRGWLPRSAGQPFQARGQIGYSSRLCSLRFSTSDGSPSSEMTWIRSAVAARR